MDMLKIDLKLTGYQHILLIWVDIQTDSHL